MFSTAVFLLVVAVVYIATLPGMAPGGGYPVKTAEDCPNRGKQPTYRKDPEYSGFEWKDKLRHVEVTCHLCGHYVQYEVHCTDFFFPQHAEPHP